MKTAIKFLIISILLITALTLGGVAVLAVYDKLFGIYDTDLVQTGIKTGIGAWVIIILAKLFAISGKKNVETKTV
ncbi:MAG: hypothetical protein J5685_03345 [Clostridiales bacterium]|nr:hypothetical protein [Clostridiales bacterium]